MFPKRICILFSAVLLAASVFTACGGDGSGIPAATQGFWRAANGADWYGITQDSLRYGYGPGSIFAEPLYKGQIRSVEYFTGSSGVIIIEYDPDRKQTYYDYDAGYNVIGGPYPPPGNFIGVYFRNLTAKSGEFATAYDAAKPHGCEEATLEAARAAFTLDAMGTYIFQMPGYARL
ncbi:MAG: hypothetical protein LBD31_08130 [Treponema sp.]|jgi:hypothetical protein|nr:hypothetical protein [Treponema sp.]